MTFLPGLKTYLTGGAMILAGVAALVSQTEVLGVDPAGSFQMIMNGVGFITLRAGVAKVAG